MNSELGQCLKFNERNDEYLMAGRLNIVASGGGCWSYIGKIDFPMIPPFLHILGRVDWNQEISLGDGCDGRGRTLHEFMHALGFLHEHQRADRDEHITVKYD